MKNKLLRTFFSIPIPEEIRSIKNMFYRSMKDNDGEIKWIRDYQLHLTLTFLGHTPVDSTDSIVAVVNDIFCDVKPMKFYIEKTGCFPSPARPRVLWLGISGDTKQLESLVKKINSALLPLGYHFDNNQFIPHITIARIRYPQKHTPNVNEFLKSSYDRIVFHADRVQFVSSELLTDGAVYTILKSFPLGGKI